MLNIVQIDKIDNISYDWEVYNFIFEVIISASLAMLFQAFRLGSCGCLIRLFFPKL